MRAHKREELSTIDLDDLVSAVRISRQSPNLSRKVGACLRVADGRTFVACNTFPDGVEPLPERLLGAERYDWLAHAEESVLGEAASAGAATAGATMSLPWFPCCPCARNAVGHGVGRLICTAPDFDEPRWGAGFVKAWTMLVEKGVEIVLVDKALVEEILAEVSLEEAPPLAP